jgi:hypothetical protein
VPYRRAANLIDRVRKLRRVNRSVLRRLQRYMVNLRIGPGSIFEKLEHAGWLRDLHPDLDLKAVDSRCYDLEKGIVFKELSPEDLFG